MWVTQLKTIKLKKESRTNQTRKSKSSNSPSPGSCQVPYIATGRIWGLSTPFVEAEIFFRLAPVRAVTVAVHTYVQLFYCVWKTLIP